MNSTYGLVIFALLVAAVSAAPKAPCPKSQSLHDIPDHELSHVFYRCASGRHVRFVCPSGLVYNPLRGVCDFHRSPRDDITTSSPATVSTESTVVGGETPGSTTAPTASSTITTLGTPGTSTPVTVSSTTTVATPSGQTPQSTTPPGAHSSTASTVTTLTPPTGSTTSPATIAARNFRRPYVPRFLRKTVF